MDLPLAVSVAMLTLAVGIGIGAGLTAAELKLEKGPASKAIKAADYLIAAALWCLALRWIYVWGKGVFRFFFAS